MARVVCITLNPALDLAFNLDALTLGHVNRPTGAQLEAAGKGVNVARVLASLGHEVIVSGFLGEENDAPFSLAFPVTALKMPLCGCRATRASMPNWPSRAVG